MLKPTSFSLGFHRQSECPQKVRIEADTCFIKSKCPQAGKLADACFMQIRFP